jgi:ABC-type transport system involved in multi-copper enzyme maturation permease subunit
MSPLLRKEIRCLLPMWCLAMVLAVAPVWLLWPGSPPTIGICGPNDLVFVLCCLGMGLLGIASFGQELSSGMLATLLTTSVSRAHVWRVKVRALAIAIGIVLVAYCISTYLRVDWFSGGDDQLSSNIRLDVLVAGLLAGGLAACATFAGGLWTTLLFRQISAAFWFCFLVPIGLFLLVFGLVSALAASAAFWTTYVVLVGYCVGGYVWAKRLFLNAEDLEWVGGTIALPTWSDDARAKDKFSKRKRRPIWALVGKEFQAQQATFVLAFALLALHVLVMAFRKTAPGYISAHRQLEMLLAVFPFLWLALPVIVGSVAIAEERRLGTLEGQLCLPVRRWWQFLAKTGIAVLIGCFLGALVPVVVEYVGSILLGHQPKAQGLRFQNEVLHIGAPLFLGLSGALTVLALYGSSLARNSLQAIGVAIAATVAWFIALSAIGDRLSIGGVLLWSGPLLRNLAVPVLLLAVTRLIYSNYAQARISLATWCRNILSLSAAVAITMLTTTLVYHRVWETWIPREPRHDRSAVIQFQHLQQKSHTPPRIRATSNRIAVVQPNGALLLTERTSEVRALSSLLPFLPRVSTGPWRSTFVDGTDWVEVALLDASAFAITADGVLWDISACFPKASGTTGLPRPKPFDTGPWRAVIASFPHFNGLKRDGTLWEWGQKRLTNQYALYHINAYAASYTNLPSPVQIGTNSDWTGIAGSAFASIGVKRDKSIWVWRSYPEWEPLPKGSLATQSDAPVPSRIPALPSDTPTVFSSSDPLNVTMISPDGSL